jgi:hypothetical protein
MSAENDLGGSIFPAEMHRRMAADYEAQAAVLAGAIRNTRDATLRATLVAREEQRIRNALFHRRLAEKATLTRNGTNDVTLKELSDAA